MTNEIKICPACDGVIEPPHDNKNLCFYCYYRQNTGVAKYIILHVMKESGNKWLTLQQISDKVNKWRIEHDKPLVKSKAVYNILHRYSVNYETAKRKKKGYLVLKKHKKVTSKKGGRPYVMYRLSTALLKRESRHLRRIEMGLPVNSTISKGKKFRMTQDYTKRARAIELKIKKGEYEPFRYLVRDSI